MNFKIFFISPSYSASFRDNNSRILSCLTDVGHLDGVYKMVKEVL